MNFTEAFAAAGVRLRQVRGIWSAMPADESFVAVTVWENEWAKLNTAKPVLGPAHHQAEKYFHNDVSYIEQWRAVRLERGKGDIDGLNGWNKLKKHHERALREKLPLRIIIVQAGKPDKDGVSTVSDARHRDDWCAAVTYFDSATGAYEYAIWRRVVKQPNPTIMGP
jgi:hypothetical protein